MMYHPIITHDIDRLYKWKYSKSVIGEYWRKLGGHSSWDYKEIYTSYRNRKSQDPFDNLRNIASLDAEAGLDSVFYIMTTRETHPKNINDYEVQDIREDLKFLIASGAEIGIHMGYLTYDDKVKMQTQKRALEAVIDRPVVRSRQHYLRYEHPTTFRYLSEIGIQNDSSILVEGNNRPYDTYKIFDDAYITETPLVFMDTHHMGKSDDEILTALEKSLQPAKNNGGEAMILWHNNYISNNRELGLYKEALQIIRTKK